MSTVHFIVSVSVWSVAIHELVVTNEPLSAGNDLSRW